jgi:hypothetical protein
MRERALAAGAVLVVAVCCGGPALLGGLLGGLTLAAVLRTSALAFLGLGAVVAVVVFVARRRRCHRDMHATPLPTPDQRVPPS